MGLGGISIWQLLIVLVIVFAIFGTKKLRNIGSDLGSAIKGFKQGIKDDDATGTAQDSPPEAISQAPQHNTNGADASPNNSTAQPDPANAGENNKK